MQTGVLCTSIDVTQEQRERHSPTEELETAIRTLLQCTQELRLQLQQTALEQTAELIESSKEDVDLVSHLRAAAVSLDGDRFEECSERFQEHIDHVQEVCKLLRHGTELPVSTEGSALVSDTLAAVHCYDGCSSEYIC